MSSPQEKHQSPKCYYLKRDPSQNYGGCISRRCPEPFNCESNALVETRGAAGSGQVEIGSPLGRVPGVTRICVLGPDFQGKELPF